MLADHEERLPPVEQSKQHCPFACDVTKTNQNQSLSENTLFQNREDLFFYEKQDKSHSWLSPANASLELLGIAACPRPSLGSLPKIAAKAHFQPMPATVAQDTNNHAFVNITGATTQVVDLSGNGQSFIRPQNYLGTGYSSGASVYYATGVSTGVNNSANSTYFMTFTVRVTNNSDVSTDVYIGTGSGVAASTTVNATNSAKAALATRVGIFDAASATPDTKIGRTLWDPNTNDTTNEVIDTTSTGGTEAFFAGSKVYTHELTKDSLVPNSETQYYGRGTLAAPATSNAVARAKPEYLCTLPALNDERLLTISMWIEGTDSNASDVCISGHVGLTLNLTGVQHAA